MRAFLIMILIFGFSGEGFAQAVTTDNLTVMEKYETMQKEKRCDDAKKEYFDFKGELATACKHIPACKNYDSSAKGKKNSFPEVCSDVESNLPDLLEDGDTDDITEELKKCPQLATKDADSKEDRSEARKRHEDKKKELKKLQDQVLEVKEAFQEKMNKLEEDISSTNEAFESLETEFQEKLDEAKFAQEDKIQAMMAEIDNINSDIDLLSTLKVEEIVANYKKVVFSAQDNCKIKNIENAKAIIDFQKTRSLNRSKSEFRAQSIDKQMSHGNKSSEAIQRAAQMHTQCMNLAKNTMRIAEAKLNSDIKAVEKQIETLARKRAFSKTNLGRQSEQYQLLVQTFNKRKASKYRSLYRKLTQLQTQKAQLTQSYMQKEQLNAAREQQLRMEISNASLEYKRHSEGYESLSEYLPGSSVKKSSEHFETIMKYDQLPLKAKMATNACFGTDAPFEEKGTDDPTYKAGKGSK